MRPMLVLFVLFSVLLSSGSQVLLKLGMSATAMKNVISDSQNPSQIALAIATSP